jgi:hypothetical protein
MIEHAQPASKKRRPLAISLLALLMVLIGGIWLLAAIALPLLGVPLAPWYILLGAAAYFLIVGWGLWGVRRWAYLAALLMCVVLSFYQIRAAVLLGQNVLVPLLVLAVIFAYLIQPRVRAVFLSTDHQHPAPDE